MCENHISSSAEIRWFFTEEYGHSQTILDWLDHIEQRIISLNAETRTDFYLKDTGYHTGIKIRPSSGKSYMELKFLNREQIIDQPVTGKMEAYSKWSLPLPPDFDPQPENENRFIMVKKERYLVKL